MFILASWGREKAWKRKTALRVWLNDELKNAYRVTISSMKTDIPIRPTFNLYGTRVIHGMACACVQSHGSRWNDRHAEEAGYVRRCQKILHTLLETCTTSRKRSCPNNIMDFKDYGLRPIARLTNSKDALFSYFSSLESRLATRRRCRD